MQFTAPIAWNLYQALNAIVPEKWEDIVVKLQGIGQQTQEANLPYWEVSLVLEKAKEFETVLRNECLIMDTYFLSKKGAYSTKDLVENAHQHIPESVRKMLSEQTKQDFDQAGKCLAFDVPRACAFQLATWN